MGAADSYDDKARLYALVDPARMIEQSEAIARAILEALEVAPSDVHQIVLSESSAWLDYRLAGELWERAAPAALPPPEQALEAAEGLLGRLERGCSDANPAWPAPLRGIALMPPTRLLRRAGLHAVPRRDGRGWDHWLYRAEPRLQLDGGATIMAGVFGAQIEVRIGDSGRVIGFNARWRPLSGERLYTDLTPFRPGADEDEHEHEHGGHHGDGHGPDHDESEARPPLVYVLDGDGIPQHYLAPYYLWNDGHHLNLASASPWSLTVDVTRIDQGDATMTLLAVAQGGSGDYVYNWASCSLADPETGLNPLGSGSTGRVDTVDGNATASMVALENGHHIVMLNVKDRATGAFKHHQQQVFSSPFADGAA